MDGKSAMQQEFIESIELAPDVEVGAIQGKFDDLRLDHAKLLGFRNLIDVRRSERDLSESADLAFHKRGTEGQGFA